MTAKRDFVREIADKCRPVLEELARTERVRGKKLQHRGLITYGELARIVGPQVGLRDLDPHDTRLSSGLGDLSAETYDERSVLISVLVVNADTLVPGKGFFQLARDHLGAYPTHASHRNGIPWASEPPDSAHSKRASPSPLEPPLEYISSEL